MLSKVITKYKSVLFFCFFLIVGYSSKSQHSKSIDSVVVTELSIIKKRSDIFKSIYANTFNESFYKRIDSIEFNNVIIEAEKYDSEFYLQEFYYLNKNDSFPSIVYFGGILEHNQGFYDFYDKKFLSTEITSIKKRQTLNYNTKFIRYTNGCGTFMDTIKKRKKRLMQTHQIQLYYIKHSKSLKCSFQTPAKNPKFIVEKRAISF